MSPAALVWIHRAALLLHLAGVVVWMGAVAYYLLILQPALRMAGIERPVRYALLVAIKARLRRVVGVALIVIVASGLVNARLRGLLGGATRADDVSRRVFFWKMIIVGVLVLIFLCALPALKRVRTGAIRGKLFTLVHVAVLILGGLATLGGILLAR